jgi:hypothetical protein
MTGVTNTLIALFIAFFFAKTGDTEWYWWVALGFLVLVDEISKYLKGNI